MNRGSVEQVVKFVGVDWQHGSYSQFLTKQILKSRPGKNILEIGTIFRKIFERKLHEIDYICSKR